MEANLHYTLSKTNIPLLLLYVLPRWLIKFKQNTCRLHLRPFVLLMHSEVVETSSGEKLGRPSLQRHFQLILRDPEGFPGQNIYR